MKRTITAAAIAILLTLQLCVGVAIALNLSPEVRTVPYTPEGDTVTVSNAKAQNGKLLFNSVCAQCHAGGITKTNPNVNLSLESLALAEPRRDNVLALVDYLQHPTTYDGELELAEFHPCTERSDIWTEMRNLTQDDLEDISAHILIQPAVRGLLWGGGKAYS